MTTIYSITDVLEKTISDFDNSNSHGLKEQLTSTGSQTLDKYSGGFHKGALTVIAGRPGMGKSALSLSLAYQIANHKTTVGYISTERTTNELLYHIAAALSNIPLYSFVYGFSKQSQLKTLYDIKDQLVIPLLLSSNKTYKIKDVVTRCEEFVDNGSEVIFIDCVQFLASYYEGDPLVSDRSGSVSEAFSIIEILNKFANDNNVAIVITSQIALDVEWRGGDKRPYLHDLKWAGYLEDIATTVLLVYRPEYYGITEDEEGAPTEGLAEIIIAKNKFGKIGDCTIKYNPETRWFYE